MNEEKKIIVGGVYQIMNQTIDGRSVVEGEAEVKKVEGEHYCEVEFMMEPGEIYRRYVLPEHLIRKER